MEFRITSIKKQVRNNQRVNIYLDGEYAFSLARIVAAWIQVGQVISEEKIAQLELEDTREYAHQMALKYISIRPRSEQEVKKHLISKSISEEVIDQVIDRLRENGLINDLKFAQNWVENRCYFHPRSKRALIYELTYHGIHPKNIESVLKDLDDLDLAIQTADKQAQKIKAEDWNTFRKKLSGYLARRGFDYDTSNQAIKYIWDEYQYHIKLTQREE